MTKVIPVTKEHLDTLRSVSVRLMVLSNALCEIDNKVSVSVEWASRPGAIHIYLFRWNEEGIESAESATLYYNQSDSNEQKKALLDKLTEWEETYGVL